MKSPASEYVTLAEVLELTRPFEEFEAAGRAVARRLEAEGIRELVMLQLYGSPDSTEAGVVLTFSDGRKLMEHIRMISGWEEFQRFGATLRLVHMRAYGALSEEAQAWVRQFGGSIQRFEHHLAGFVR
jgi:hypothetical protein